MKDRAWLASLSKKEFYPGMWNASQLIEAHSPKSLNRCCQRKEIFSKMADTGENREIKERVEAHEAEVIRESKQLVAKTKEASQNRKARSVRMKAKQGENEPIGSSRK
jgi:hypothetical protein